MDTRVAPPPYPGSEETGQDDTTRVILHELGLVADDEYKEELRRIFVDILCADYNVTRFETPRANRWTTHRLLSHARALRDFGAERKAQEWPRSLSQVVPAIWNFIEHDLLKPAQELGISNDIALRMVLRYAANTGIHSDYTGCIPYLLSRFGRLELFSKCKMDLAVVIPALVPANTTLRKQLGDACVKTMKRWWYCPDDSNARKREASRIAHKIIKEEQLRAPPKFRVVSESVLQDLGEEELGLSDATETQDGRHNAQQSANPRHTFGDWLMCYFNRKLRANLGLRLTYKLWRESRQSK